MSGKNDTMPASSTSLSRSNTEDQGAGPSASTPKNSSPGGIGTEKTTQILDKVNMATKTVEENIAAAARRGENLDELQTKTSKCISFLI